MDYRFFAPWDQVLPREPGHVVAFAGGRAADALADAAAQVYAAEGVPVVRSPAGGADPGDAAVVLARVDAPVAAPADPAGGAAWPERTSLAVLVLPVDGVGGRADAFWDAAALAPDVAPWTTLTWELLDPPVLAAVDAVPAAVPVVLALAGLEDQPDSIGLFAFTGRMMAHPRVPVVLFCGEGEDGPSVRACCRADDA